MPSNLISRTLRHRGHKFSMRLEPEFWAALEDIAEQKRITLSELVGAAGGQTHTHTGTARVIALQFYQALARRQGEPAGSRLPC